jgi:hypothetical protein
VENVKEKERKWNIKRKWEVKGEYKGNIGKTLGKKSMIGEKK